MNKPLILAVALGLTLIASSASTTVWIFSFSGNSGQIFSAGGTFITSGSALPATVTGIGAGIGDTAGGGQITGLLAPGAYGGNDNKLYSDPSAYVDGSGISFVAGGLDFRLYNISADTYELVNSNGSGDGGGTLFLAESASAPEPATWLIMFAGLFGVGAFLRQRRSGLLSAA